MRLSDFVESTLVILLHITKKPASVPSSLACAPAASGTFVSWTMAARIARPRSRAMRERRSFPFPAAVTA